MLRCEQREVSTRRRKLRSYTGAGTYAGLKEARDNIEKERDDRRRWLVVYEGLCERDVEDEYSLELRLLEEAKEVRVCLSVCVCVCG